MAGWVPSVALLLVLMAAATLCYPFRQAAGPRSFPSSHYKPRTLLDHAPKREFTPQLSVAGARHPAVEEGVGQAVSDNPWGHGNKLPVSSGAENVPNPEDSNEKPDSSGSSAVKPEVSGSLPPGGPGASSFGPYFPPPQPEFQPGELFRMEKTFEHGDYESERETQGFPQQPRRWPQPVPLPYDSTPESVARSPADIFPPPVSRPFVPYPFDYYFLTGQYPPGTATHFSSSFERGRNYNQDLHYEKYEEDYEPGWPQEYSAEASQNSGQGGSHGSTSNSRQDPASSSGYYMPYNQPGQVKLPVHSYQRRVGH
ncbi:uncharacterized protein LOC133468342 [Phyllopteryx taeniolatus]|uniref:uncharacterized protein LOC133468342 n=1 Tax=Phyllopteryx taeniolatus TaxID=161469 RepID=UPI002AD24610|nr:uncharacterized protein LOC133468342 [Phyllopteryx taeniolatus]